MRKSRPGGGLRRRCDGIRQLAKTTLDTCFSFQLAEMNWIETEQAECPVLGIDHYMLPVQLDACFLS